MTQLIINFRHEDEDALVGFPFMDGQAEIPTSYGDAGVVTVDLAGRTTTPAQEQWLAGNSAIVGYEVVDGDLMDEA